MKNSRQQLVRYLITGVTSFITEYGIFLVLSYGFGAVVWAAHIISYVLALCVNFMLSRHWTFRATDKPSIKQLPKYLVLVAVNLPLTTLIISILNDMGLEPFMAKFIVVAMAATWNYIIYNKLIFRRGTGAS